MNCYHPQAEVMVQAVTGLEWISPFSYSVVHVTECNVKRGVWVSRLQARRLTWGLHQGEGLSGRSTIRFFPPVAQGGFCHLRQFCLHGPARGPNKTLNKNNNNINDLLDSLDI